MPRAEARAALISLTVGIVLLVTKYVAYYLTNSAAIFSDATESIANVLAAAVALYCLARAHQPADEQHPYGHGKIEFLSAWFEASMIIMASIFIFAKTMDAIHHDSYAEPDESYVGIILMAAAMMVNGVVGVYLIRLGRRHDSMVLVADGKHLLTDVWTSVAVIGALFLVRITGIRLIDPIAAFIVAIYIGIMGFRILNSAAAGLMDKQDQEDERTIQQILDSHCGAAGREPRICNYHKLRHRHSGRFHWVDFHIRLPETVNVREAHSVATAIEEEIEAAIGEGNATAHVEPCDRLTCAPATQCPIFKEYQLVRTEPSPPG